MPSYAYEIDEPEDDDIIVTRDDIEAENDADELLDIRRGLEDRDDLLSMQIEAFRLNPSEDEASLMWLRRVSKAKAATGVGLSRVRQRLIKLGVIDNPLDRQIKALEAKVIERNAEILELKKRLGEA